MRIAKYYLIFMIAMFSWAHAFSMWQDHKESLRNPPGQVQTAFPEIWYEYDAELFPVDEDTVS